MPQSIVQLWEMVRNGDPHSWEILVRRYTPLVVAVARGHGLGDADVEDCTQQTWLALYSGRTQVVKPESIPAWLARVAKRKAQRLQQRDRTRQVIEQNFIETPALSRSPEDIYHSALQIARIQTALGLLDERCARLLGRMFLSSEEWTYQQLADELGIALNSLGPIRSRCLCRLKKILEGIEEDVY